VDRYRGCPLPHGRSPQTLSRRDDGHAGDIDRHHPDVDVQSSSSFAHSMPAGMQVFSASLHDTRPRESDLLQLLERYHALKSAYAVHDLDQLVLLAGLKPKLGLARPALFRNWSLAQPWTPNRRYSCPGTCSQQDALDILDAIRNRSDGLLRWIARYW
jgi:hypothetical protein